ncbi:unnamed protein product, partial [Allacma fusca]
MKPKDEGKKQKVIPNLSFQPPPPSQYQMYGAFQPAEIPNGPKFQGFLPP